MTDHEIKCARALENVSFPPGSSQKAFARDMCLLTDRHPEKPLSQKQSTWLSSLVWTYRRQIRDRVLVHDCGVIVGAAKPPVTLPPKAFSSPPRAT